MARELVPMYGMCPYTGKTSCLSAYKAFGSAAADQEMLAVGAAIRIVIYSIYIASNLAGRVDVHFEGTLNNANHIASLLTAVVLGDWMNEKFPYPVVAPTAGQDVDVVTTTTDDALVVIKYNLWTPPA